MNEETPEIEIRIETKGPSELFDKAFEDASKLLNVEEQLKHARGRLLRRLQKFRDQWDAWLRRRTQRHQVINRLTSQYIELHGGEVPNIADLLDYLGQNGIEIVPDRSAGRALTERAVRKHLEKAFGIEGVPGRKPGR